MTDRERLIARIRAVLSEARDDFSPRGTEEALHMARAVAADGFVHPDVTGQREAVEMQDLARDLFEVVDVVTHAESAKELWARGWRVVRRDEPTDPRLAVWKELLAVAELGDGDEITEAVLVLRTRDFGRALNSVCVGRTRGTDYVLTLGMLHAALQIESQGAWKGVEESD